MKASYNYKKIESKWQKIWKKEKLFEAKDSVKGKKNFYHLVMFPYPSGDLHIGHWYIFAPADMYARFKRMQELNVLSPIGFVAFGLPAENAAIKRKIHPEKWTMGNIKTMAKQLESIGNSYDWSRLIVTCQPEYYKWNQWLFLKLFEKGLAYRKKAAANWCPSCKTVLANEQVIDGYCERCQTAVVQKEIDQWLLKITDYAERLLEDLEVLDWPERTKIMQRNWIGRSEGAEKEFPIWISDYVIMGYGTGAIMAVPAHDERDFAFAQEFKLPIIQSVSKDGTLKETISEPYLEDGAMVNAGDLDKLPNHIAKIGRASCRE